MQDMMAVLSWERVSESLHEKETFDRRSESRESVSHRNFKEYFRQRKSRDRDPKVGVFLVTLRQAFMANLSLVLF